MSLIGLAKATEDDIGAPALNAVEIAGTRLKEAGLFIVEDGGNRELLIPAQPMIGGG